MGEEPKVSKRITRKLERYLNRERVEQRFDPSGKGVYTTHPLVVKLELAYLVANEDQKRKSTEQQEGENDSYWRPKKQSSDQVTSPRVRSLPQMKTKVQRSEIDRLAKNASSALKTVDADNISTVYRFRQQMVPYKVKNQGKVRQVSTSVHAMLNAEEAWRYRKENDERENVKKYKEKQKAKAKELEEKQARERELDKLPVEVRMSRMELKRQRELYRASPLHEKLLASTLTPEIAENTVPMATEYESTVVEANEYEDDFEGEEDDENDRVEKEVGDRQDKKETGSKEVTLQQDQSATENEDEALIAAVTEANEMGSIASLDPSAYSSMASLYPRSDHTQQPDDTVSYDEAASAYADEHFESDSNSEGVPGEQSVFMTDSVPGSRNGSRAPSPSKPTKVKSTLDSWSSGDDSASLSKTSRPASAVKGQSQGAVDRVDSAEVNALATLLVRTAVKGAAGEEGVSYRSSRNSSRRSSVRSRQTEDGMKDEGSAGKEESKTTQEYTRTESVISLSDRVKKDIEKES